MKGLSKARKKDKATRSISFVTWDCLPSSKLQKPKQGLKLLKQNRNKKVSRGFFPHRHPGLRSGISCFITRKPPLLHSAKNYCIFIHDSICPADLAFVPGRLFHYLLDADLPFATLDRRTIRGSIHPMGKLAPWRST